MSLPLPPYLLHGFLAQYGVQVEHARMLEIALAAGAFLNVNGGKKLPIVGEVKPGSTNMYALAAVAGFVGNWAIVNFLLKQPVAEPQ